MYKNRTKLATLRTAPLTCAPRRVGPGARERFILYLIMSLCSYLYGGLYGGLYERLTCWRCGELVTRGSDMNIHWIYTSVVGRRHVSLLAITLHGQY
jgi:hypothetical protein